MDSIPWRPAGDTKELEVGTCSDRSLHKTPQMKAQTLGVGSEQLSWTGNRRWSWSCPGPAHLERCALQSRSAKFEASE